MKKFLVVAISAVFLLGFAASAYAIHAEIPSETQAVVAKGETQITIGGSIRVRGELRKNMDYVDSTACGSCHRERDGSWWDQRVRLWLDAQVSENVKGFVMIEAGDCNLTQYEDYANAYGLKGAKDSDTWTWGDTCGGGNLMDYSTPAPINTHGATGVYGKGNSKRGLFRVLEAWIDYKNDIANVKIGHMPLALGNHIFFDHRKFGDDALVLYKDIDSLHIAALTAKFDEVNTAVADDANAYVLLFVYKGDGWNASGDVTWVNDNAFTGLIAADDADLINFGIRGDLDISDNINIRGDLELQVGDTNAAGLAGLPCGTANCDFGGYAFVVGGTVKLDPVTLDLEFGMGSGDDNASDDDIEVFVTSLSSGIPYITFVHGTRSINAAGAGNGITNLTYLKGTISGSPFERTTAKASIIWLKATEKYPMVVPFGSPTFADDIGIEIDAEVRYQLGKNLVYWVEGGYLFVTNEYARAVNIPDYSSEKEDDAYAIRHGIELTF